MYQVKDYVKVRVKSIDLDENKFEVELVENEAILQNASELPSYYRNLNDDDELTSYDNLESVRHLCANPNLSEFLSISIDCAQSALKCFKGKLLTPRELAQTLRFQQNHRFAMSHVERGAELTRNGKCFEAIQCFNKALNVDEKCADALVGRGAACAGSKNFSAALSDFNKALEIEPEHKNAKRYRVEVFIAYGKELEKDNHLLKARKKYECALEFSNGLNKRALNALQRLAPTGFNNNIIPTVQQTSSIEVVDLSDDSESEFSKQKSKRKFERNGKNNFGDNSYRNNSFDGAKDEIRRNKSESFNVLNNKLRTQSLQKLTSFPSRSKSPFLESAKPLNRSFSKSDDNHRKLQEMEAFILQLKKSKK